MGVGVSATKNGTFMTFWDICYLCKICGHMIVTRATRISLATGSSFTVQNPTTNLLEGNKSFKPLFIAKDIILQDSMHSGKC